jgi:hypothetical protein
MKTCSWSANILHSYKNFMIERKSLHVKNVEKIPITIYSLVTTKLILRNILNIRVAQKLLIHHSLLNNRKSKMGTSVMSIRHVGRPLFTVHNLNNI